MNSESKPSSETPSSIGFSPDDFAQALQEHDYTFQKGQVVRGRVAVHSQEGAYIEIGGKSTAFVPIQEAALENVTDLSTVLPLNEELDFLITREQNEEGQVTLSRRQLAIQRLWDTLLEKQEEQQALQVRVTGSNKGGVTVDVMGLRGFIPRSHLSQRENLNALKGETLTVGFLEVNPDTRKLVLSERLATQAATFSQLEVGQLVEGRIANIKPFGLFVDLGNTTGLIHIKQISQSYIAALSSHFSIGQSIKAIIISIDEGKGRISLSTRILENYPGELLENMDEVMESATARRERAVKSLPDA
ncbi:S1 RNA-binding domain-containing protein [Roseofilum reptotaenium CS-1145]|uniref:30S ribosomal protein S1 n=1 Tax=Roseofilum reptotaenium AO1-A TaxID=1925591 RepID=A0A1L9QN10_9CYAN|nr:MULTISPECIES: S1 RNA-binding domain-containing protein [Roseofilum]MBP0030576.1 30S ribosomal protein S1 [Roseofilum sp. Guam]MDB9515680.1 S1 RNA-binding domain-containing protein [Roseofilum reptotaenium CS-1145]OJJ22730.1 30S ribosomal protein S1 [Roseofilum reptotaenium AO1-A]